MPAHETGELAPGWSVHPGMILRRVLEDRGLRQSELAERTGLTAKHVNQIMTETIGISADVAYFSRKVHVSQCLIHLPCKGLEVLLRYLLLAAGRYRRLLLLAILA